MHIPPCPKCGQPKSTAITTWRGGKLIMRRRACDSCGHRFSTGQEPEFLLPTRAVADIGKNLHCHIKNE
jgi:transcriptional regulator NrdR family protein